nr:CHAP domain-containing protein [Agromyces seonyuensis]
MLGTVALPAYAFLPGLGGDEHSQLFDLTSAGAQDVSVSGLATNAPTTAEDGYSVVTAEDIERARREEAAAEAARWQAEVAARAGTGSYATIGVQAEGDDYPWWNTAADSQLSPLGYYTRECVDFVAWRLNRDRGTTGPYWFTNNMSGTGSAYSWADAWVRNGWPTSNEPVVGAVAWFTYNHVAYVQSIPGDGTVVIEEYNQNSDHSYHRRVIPANSVLYLYPPA